MQLGFCGGKIGSLMQAHKISEVHIFVKYCGGMIWVTALRCTMGM